MTAQHQARQPDTGQENTMRVFVAGASGAVGTRLVPRLISQDSGLREEYSLILRSRC
jgi:hypothetical protein